MGSFTAVLDVDGARCASCNGGDPAALAQIIRIVARLGYEARLRSGA